MVVTAHLSCCANSGARAAEMAAITDFISRMQAGLLAGIPSDLPVILAGDLNLVRWDSGAFAGLQQQTGLRSLPALHTGSLEDYTWRNDSESFSPGRLDYILATPGLAMGRAFVHKSEFPPSDHLPVIADLAFDANGNGLGDRWEREHQLVGSSPQDDSDQDGFSNAHEHRLGSNPRDASDRLRLVAQYSEDGMRLLLKGHGRGGAPFRLWRSADLIAWEMVPGQWWADDAPLPVDLNPPSSFYRAVLDTE